MATRPATAAVVRRVDAVARREGRARPARREGRRGLPADRHPLEPLEGPPQEDRLAAVPRLLLRALRPARFAADAELHRRGDDRVVRRQAGAGAGRRGGEHPPAGDERAAVRPVPVPEGRLAGRGGARPAEGRRRPAGEEGTERAAGAVGRSHQQRRCR